MTLDIAQFLAENIHKEMVISHFECKLNCGKAKLLKSSIRSKIVKQYGEAYLEDCQYVIIVSGEEILPDSSMKSLFGIFNRSLGKVANNMTESDIKTISSEGNESGEELVEFRFLKITLK